MFGLSEQMLVARFGSARARLGGATVPEQIQHCKRLPVKAGSALQQGVTMTEQQFPGQRPPKKMGCLKIGGIVVLGMFGLAVVGSLLPKPEGSGTPGAAASSPAAGESSAAPVVATKVTGPQLSAAYAENEVSAQAAFGDRVLEVSGTVSSIELDMMDKPVIQLEGHDQMAHVTIHLEKDQAGAAGAVRKGQKLTVTCSKVGEVMGYPQLQNCAL